MPPAPAAAPDPGAGADDFSKSWGGTRWESYKIVIAAFYALCAQRVAETLIEEFNKSAPAIEVLHGAVAIDATDAHVVLILQFLAYVVWLGLYYINNVRLYLSIPAVADVRRLFAHIALTMSLGAFYFLGATIGRPSNAQLLLILVILIIDAVFPIILGPVLSRRQRITWVLRGIVQTSGIAAILLLVSPSRYDEIHWSALWLGLMLTQLLLIAPVERFRAARLRARAGTHHTP